MLLQNDNDPNSLGSKAYYGYTTFYQNKASRPEEAQLGIDMMVEILLN